MARRSISRRSEAFAVAFAVALLVPTAIVRAADDRPAVEDETRSFWAAPVFTGERLDVRFDAMRLDQAVRFLTGEETNVVAVEALDKLATLDLRNVHTGEALDYLLQMQDLGARFQGNTVFLSPRERRSYRLPLVVQEDGKIWDDIEKGIELLRSERGVVALSKSGGVLSVEDGPNQLDHLESHVYRVLQSVLRQVEIEVKILEVVFEENEGLGIDWALFDGIFESGWNVAGGAVSGLVGLQSVSDQREIVQFGLLKPNKWRAFVDAFDEEISLDVISRPRITAMSNQPASFEVRERIPYLAKTVSYDQGIAVTEFELVFDEAGIKLEVTALAAEDGMVTLDVHPTIASVVGFTETLPDLGAQPIIDSRETRSTVRLPEGYSLVMSGLMQDRQNLTVLGVPILSKIPILGRLFRSEQVRNDKTEIVIVLTPRLKQGAATRTLAVLDRIGAVPVSPEPGVPADLACSRTHRAWELLVAGDRVGALGLAGSACRVKPSSWWTLNNLGLAQRETGFVADAEKTLRQAVRAQDPAPPAALVNLGTLLLHRGKGPEAVAFLEEAAARARRGPLRDEARLALALALESAGRKAEALELLEALGGVEGAHGPRILPRVRRILESLDQAALVVE